MPHKVLSRESSFILCSTCRSNSSVESYKNKMFSPKLLLFLACAIAMAAAIPNDPPALIGGATKLSGDDLKEAEQTLQSSLTKLAAGDGPNYKISKVNSATRQVVSGSLYKLDVDLIDGNNAVKKCQVSIWSQPWLDNGIEVTFECDGEEKVVKKHSA